MSLNRQPSEKPRPTKPLPKRPVPSRGPRPGAKQPEMPRAQAPRPVPAQPVVISVPRRSGPGGGAVLMLIILAAAVGATVWLSMRRNQAPETRTTAVLEMPGAPPAPVAATEKKSTPAGESAKPAAQPMVAPKPEPVADMPLPNVPVRPVAPAIEPTLFRAPLALDAIAARSTAELERSARVLRATLEQNAWPQYLDLLQRSLAAELKKSPDFDTVQRYDRYTDNPYFMRALLQRTFGTLLGDDARRLIAENELVRQHMIWVLDQNAILENFLRAWTPGNRMRDVLETWARLAADDPDAFGSYSNLAIACALVLEKPKKFDWNGEKVTITAEERFRWYKTRDKAGKLATRLPSMSAWELSWVVGVPVPEKEMEWALTEVGRKLKQKDWGRAYSMVPYDMQKAVTGKMKEPYEYYTFAEILKKGGVCGDRAYFAANTARSAGIPAVSVSGDGPRGPHAWIMWLADEGRWAFSGRFDGYPAGTVRDPRDGTKISEQRFERLSDNRAPSNATMMKAQRLVWLHEIQDQIGQREEAAQALEFALRTSPRQGELWVKKTDYWSKLTPPPAAAVWKKFLDALKREFRDDSELLAVAREAEDKFVLANADAATVKNELRGDVRDLSKLKGLTSLQEIRSAHSRYAELMHKDNDYAGLRRVYREALDDYGREAAKFKALARDYWQFLTAAPPEVRLAACRDIEAVYERHVETRNGDYFSIQSQNTAAAVVAEFWRQAGETKRAERLEKEIAKRGKKSTRDAL